MFVCKIERGLLASSFPINAFRSEEQLENLKKKVHESVNDDKNTADGRQSFVETVNNNENKSDSLKLSQESADTTFSIGSNKKQNCFIREKETVKCGVGVHSLYAVSQ